MLDDEPDAGSPARSMAGLAQLLAFADAVGTSRGLLLALDAQVAAAPPLVAEVQMGEQQLQLAADSCNGFSSSAPLDLWHFASGASKAVQIAVASSAADKEGLCQQFVQQLEALLYLAYKLRLPQLQRVMHRCISCNSCIKVSVLGTDALHAVASTRVLDAAGGCGLAHEAFRLCWATEVVAFAGDSKGRRHVFKPLGLTPEQQEPIKFKAELLEDLYQHKKGQVVNVVLDLFGRGHVWLSQDEPGSTVVKYPMHLALSQQLQVLPDAQ